MLLRPVSRSSSIQRPLLAPPSRQRGFAYLTNPHRFGAGPLTCDAADFDGTNDYLSRSSALTGQADTKSGVFSIWVNCDTLASNPQALLQSVDTGIGFAPIEIYIANSGAIEIRGRDAAGNPDLVIVTNTGAIATGSWKHILGSWDANTGTTASRVYVNDAPITLGTNTVVNDVQAVGASDTWWAGALNGGTNKIDAGVAELFYAPGQFLDLSVESNRRKFITSGLKPVNLGTDGSVPFAAVPLIYLHLDDGEAAANFATNRAGNGNFTVTGTLTTYASSPSD